MSNLLKVLSLILSLSLWTVLSSEWFQKLFLPFKVCLKLVVTSVLD